MLRIFVSLCYKRNVREAKTFTLAAHRQYFMSCVFSPALLTFNEIGESRAESSIFLIRIFLYVTPCGKKLLTFRKHHCPSKPRRLHQSTKLNITDLCLQQHHHENHRTHFTLLVSLTRNVLLKRIKSTAFNPKIVKPYF